MAVSKKDMDIEYLNKEVKLLNLKVEKDYKRFLEIDLFLKQKYFNQIEKGRTPNYNFIIEKRIESFENFPQCGYEMVGTFKEYYDNKYLGKVFKNFEEEQDMYNDLDNQITLYKNGK